MSGSDAPTHDELSAMKVDELRNMCGELGLMVSGKKAELIDRILAQYGPEDAEMVGSDISKEIVKDSSETEVGDAVDRLLAKFEGKGDVEEAEAVEVGVACRRVEQECLRGRGGVRGEEVPRVAHYRTLLGLELALLLR